MKYLNVGLASLMTSSNTNQYTGLESKYSNTGYAIGSTKSDGKFPWYQRLDGIEECHEVWMSFDIKILELINQDYSGACTLFSAMGANQEHLVSVFIKNDNNGMHIAIYNGALTSSGSRNNCDHIYLSDNSFSLNADKPTNIEVHFKNGENGRVDVWIDTKLFCSYRSPSAFPATAIHYVGQQGRAYTSSYGWYAYVSSIIIQTTRRIGLEKFKMLTISPDSEQNMPQGSTTQFTLSGLSDSTEFADITSVGAILQATSRDANITTGTFDLAGADIGTIDVSDSSGRAYEQAHTEMNSLTGKPWTRDDIEGKILNFTVNGAS